MPPAQLGDASTRKKPNILVTGTPGTGKTSFCELLEENIGFKRLNVGQLVRDKGFHSGKDTSYDAFIIDEDAEDRLLDEMEDILHDGGFCVEFHASQLFPERWFDLVIVLRTENALLYDRLKARGYPEIKLKENMEAEIMQICEEEARENYASEVVVSLQSNTMEDMEQNAERVEQWVAQWLQTHQHA